MRKILIHSYRLQYRTVPLAPGFGDFLRGCLALSCLAIKFNFRLSLDFYSHPLSKFIESSAPRLLCMGCPIEYFNKVSSGLEELISRRNTCLPLLLSTNAYPDPNNITQRAREVVRILLQFTPATDPESVLELSALRLRYAVLHVRIRDEYDANRIPNECFYVELQEAIDTRIIPVYGTNIVIMSNNIHIRNRLSRDYGLPSTSSNPIHLGKRITRRAESAIRDTVIDFRLMSNCSCIYSYSEYGWPSGFSHQCAEIYQIPFVDLRGLMRPTAEYPVVVEDS